MWNFKESLWDDIPKLLQKFTQYDRNEKRQKVNANPWLKNMLNVKKQVNNGCLLTGFYNGDMLNCYPIPRTIFLDSQWSSTFCEFGLYHYNWDK